MSRNYLLNFVFNFPSSNISTHSANRPPRLSLHTRDISKMALHWLGFLKSGSLIPDISLSRNRFLPLITASHWRIMFRICVDDCWFLLIFYTDPELTERFLMLKFRNPYLVEFLIISHLHMCRFYLGLCWPCERFIGALGRTTYFPCSSFPTREGSIHIPIEFSWCENWPPGLTQSQQV